MPEKTRAKNTGIVMVKDNHGVSKRESITPPMAPQKAIRQQTITIAAAQKRAVLLKASFAVWWSACSRCILRAMYGPAAMHKAKFNSGMPIPKPAATTEWNRYTAARILVFI